MKLYVIPEGTQVTLVDNIGNRKSMVSNAEATFTETIIDPVREWNNNRKNISYVQFRLEDGMKSKINKQYTMVEVDYNLVEILC